MLFKKSSTTAFILIFNIIVIIFLLSCSPRKTNTSADPRLKRESRRPVLSHTNIHGLGMPAYVTKRERFLKTIKTARSLGINTIVLDIKQVDPRGDYYKKVPIVLENGQKKTTYKLIERHLGNVFFQSTNEMVKKIGADRTYVTNLSSLQEKFWDNGLELGVRLCLFGDYKMAEYFRKNKIKKTDRIIITNLKQSRWIDQKKVNELTLFNRLPLTLKNPANNPVVDQYFVDPLNEMVLKYNLALIKELYQAGIRIFIFDYVRMEDPRMEKKYDPDKYLFNHVAVEQSLAYLKKELDSYIKEHGFGAPALFSISVFGRVLYHTYTGTMDPVGQNIKTFAEMGYYISSMDYTHLLLPQFRKMPYEGRKIYLRHGINKIGKAPFFPWVDSAVRSAPKGKEAQYIYKELKAVLDSGIDSYVFWIPSGKEKEYARVFKALRMLK